MTCEKCGLEGAQELKLATGRFAGIEDHDSLVLCLSCLIARVSSYFQKKGHAVAVEFMLNKRYS